MKKQKEITFECISNLQYKHRGHWFDDSSMRFFKSKVYNPVYCGKKNWYFVSSERNSGMYADNKRLFSVRYLVVKTGSVETLGDFQGYNTQAHKAARAAAQGEINK